MGGTRDVAAGRAVAAAERATVAAERAGRFRRMADKLVVRTPRDCEAVAAARRVAEEYELAVDAVARAGGAARGCDANELAANAQEAVYTLAVARRTLRDQSAIEEEVDISIQRAGDAAMWTHDRAAVNAVAALGQKGRAYVVTCENDRWAAAERAVAAAERAVAAAEQKAVSAERAVAAAEKAVAFNPFKLAAAAEAWASAAVLWASAAEAWDMAGVG